MDCIIIQQQGRTLVFQRRAKDQVPLAIIRQCRSRYRSLNFFTAAEFFTASGDVERMQTMRNRAVFLGHGHQVERAGGDINHRRASDANLRVNVIAVGVGA